MASSLPLARRFPAAHQLLRLCLIDELRAIAPAVRCDTEPSADGSWLVSLSWPAIEYADQRRFSALELQVVYGAWSGWARDAAAAIADRLPV